MKTVIFNGSPRRNGDTEAILEETLKYLTGEIQIIRAYDEKIKGCVDCRYCWEHPRCAWPDWQETDAAIREADNILVASPIYFSDVTGDLLRTMSKAQVYWSAHFLRREEIIPKPKRGGIILAYAGNCDLKYPLHTLKVYLKNMRVEEFYDPVVSTDTDRLPAREDLECLKKAKALAEFFNASR